MMRSGRADGGGSARGSTGDLLPVLRVSFCVLAICATPVCRADDTARDQPPDAPAKNWSEDVKRSAEQFSVYASDEAEKPLPMTAAYKWSNPARTVLGDRLCLLYLHEGRPVASCKVYPTGNLIVHTFISLTDLPLVARRNNAVVWSPPESAPMFIVLPDAEAPQATPNLRRVQLKSLAREFSMETGAGEAKRQSAARELRLLPQPLHRYNVPDEGQAGIIDGAAFCFIANGGNPQALLLIEAVRAGDSMLWRYGFSRRTFAKLKAFHQKREVWSVDFLPAGRQQSNDTFYKLDLPVAATADGSPVGQ